MRVTQQMMTDRSAANLSSAMDRLLRLQTQMSSGRRLQQPSDDPTGVTRALAYRKSLGNLDQYQSNVDWGKNELSTVEQGLASANTLLVSARELATSLANDNYDATARQSAAVEAHSILDQLIQMGNTQKDGRYLFSGFQTRTQTLLASANGVVYQGDHGTIYQQVEAASQMGVNLLGSDVFLAPLQILGDGFDLNRGVTAAALLADLHGGNGIDLTPGTIQFTDENSGQVVMVDLSAATSVGSALTAINTQLTTAGLNGVTASVSPSGNGIRLVASDNGLISNATKLANLHGGTGIDLVPGRFRIATDDNSINVQIDLTGAQTVGDVITAFNTQMVNAGVSNVTLGLNGAQTGLQITDANVGPLGLRVVDPPEESTALGLGLSGYVNAQLVGTNLAPSRVITVAEGGLGQTTAADLGITGTFSAIKDGADLDPGITLASAVTELDLGRGISLGQIRLRQGSDAVVVNLTTAVTVGDVINRLNASGLAVTASLNSTGRGIQIVPTTSDKSLIIEDADGTGSSAKLGIAGSPDLMGTMMLLSRALETDDRAMVGRLLGPLTKAADHLLDMRGSVGAKVKRLDATSGRLSDMSQLMTQLLSGIEDADIIKVTTELANQQNVYQSALNAVSRVLLPSLVDFIR